jgi:hypothetical protein
MTLMSTTNLEQLQDFLEAIAPGSVTDRSVVGTLEQMLGDCWHILSGNKGGMTGRKLLYRTENMCWNPPLLTFKIERHGGAVLGSTRAEMQTWTVDVNEPTATYDSRGSYRQLVPNSPRLNVVPLAEKAVSMILANQDGDCLKWSKDRGRVTIRTGKIIPAEETVKATLIARRKRLAKQLRERLEGEGWQLVEGTSPHTYEKAAKAGSLE